MTKTTAEKPKAATKAKPKQKPDVKPEATLTTKATPKEVKTLEQIANEVVPVTPVVPVKRPAPPLLSLIALPKNIEELPDPDNGPYLIATKKGYFLMDTNHYGKYLTPTSEAPMLDEMRPMFWYSIPKMPDSIIGQAWSFFRAIYEERKSEAMVDITWTAEKGYRLFVPPQRASAAGVKCERTPEHYKGQMVGTIHSHCNFGAFHSGTDTHDADGHDGLHITIGNVLSAKPSIAIMISKSKIRWDFKVEDVQENAEITMYSHPEWWMDFVQDPEPFNRHRNGSQYGVGSVNTGIQWCNDCKERHLPNRHKPEEIGSGSTSSIVLPGQMSPPKHGDSEAPKGKAGLVVVGGGKNGNKQNGQQKKSEKTLVRHQDIDGAIRASTHLTDATIIDRLTVIQEELFLVESLLNGVGIDFDYDFGLLPDDDFKMDTRLSENLGLTDDDLPFTWRNHE